MRTALALALVACAHAPRPPAAPPPRAPAPQASRCGETPKGRVTLPADDGVHDAPIEWWYWTGHLRAADGRWFGFEEVFFKMERNGLTIGQSAHFAITDVGGKTFHHLVKQTIGGPQAAPGGFDVTIGGVSARGGGGHDALRGTVDGYALELALDEKKPPVLQHDGGYTDYSFGGYTYYYSRERMAAKGTITVGGEAIPVDGTAWFDHQWGDLEKAIEGGWDWFAVQLDDGREAMIFVSRAGDARALVGGSFTDASCATASLAPTDVAIEPLGSWTSRAGCTYPSGWNVRVKDLNLTLRPVLQDQLMPTQNPDYWEGAVEVSGGATGRGYVELTNYCR